MLLALAAKKAIDKKRSKSNQNLNQDPNQPAPQMHGYGPPQNGQPQYYGAPPPHHQQQGGYSQQQQQQQQYGGPPPQYQQHQQQYPQQQQQQGGFQYGSPQYQQNAGPAPKHHPSQPVVMQTPYGIYNAPPDAVRAAEKKKQSNSKDNALAGKVGAHALIGAFGN